MAEEKARAKKILLGVKDDVNDDRRQFNIVSVITDGDLLFSSQYGKMFTDDEIGSFDVKRVGSQGVLEFLPIDGRNNEYIYTFLSYETKQNVPGGGNFNYVGSSVKLESTQTEISAGTAKSIFTLPSEFVSSKLIIETSDITGDKYEYNEINLVNHSSESEAYYVELGGLKTNSVGIVTYGVSRSGSNAVVTAYSSSSNEIETNVYATSITGVAITETAAKPLRFGQLKSNYVSIASSTDPTAQNILQLSPRINFGYFIAQVTDTTNNKVELAEVFLLKNNTESTILEYGNVQTGNSLGEFNAVTSDTTTLTYTPKENIDVEITVLEHSAALTYFSVGPQSINFVNTKFSSGLSVFNDSSDFNNRKNFDLFHKGTPIFERRFDASISKSTDATKPLDLENNLINIPTHFFNTGEKVSYRSDPLEFIDFFETTTSSTSSAGSASVNVTAKTGVEVGDLVVFPGIERRLVLDISGNTISLGTTLPSSVSSGSAVTFSRAFDDPNVTSSTIASIEIESTFIAGAGTTDKLSGDLYIYKQDNDRIGLCTSPEDAFSKSLINFTNVGLGKNHYITTQNQNAKALILLDNVVQSPIVNTSITESLVKDFPVLDVVAEFSGITSFFSSDLIKIGDEIMKISAVGVGSTTFVEVQRAFMGTGISSHSSGDTITKVTGSYNIVASQIHFSDAPYGPIYDEVNGDVDIRSSFQGRVFTRTGNSSLNQDVYNNNYLFDDVSANFDAKTKSFNLKNAGSEVAGFSTSNAFVVVNGVLQIGDIDYTLNETSGTTDINFTGTATSISYDPNNASVPRGGIIVSLGSSGGLGYQPLVAAGGTAIVSSAGTIANISIGNSGSGYRIGIQTTINVGVQTSSTGIPNIEFIGTAAVENGHIVSIAITNPGSGYTNTNPPDVVFDDPLSYSNLNLKYQNSSGLGTEATVDIVVGQGSSIIDFTIKNFGYGYKQNDILTLDIGGTTGIPTDTSYTFENFSVIVDRTYTDSFSAWSVGELQTLDTIESLFDGIRKRFPIKNDGEQFSIESGDGSFVDLSYVILVFVNGVLQDPSYAYTFDGGSFIEFSEAPKEKDKCSIIFYKGTPDIDVTNVEVTETITTGDTLRLVGNKIDLLEKTRVVSNILLSDLVETSPYNSVGITSDLSFQRPVIWCKQRNDSVVDGKIITKNRSEYEAFIQPTSHILRSVGIGTTKIYTDGAKSIFDSDLENTTSTVNGKIEIIDNDLTLVSASATAVVSSNGTISSISIGNSGSGYVSTPEVSITNSQLGTKATLVASLSGDSVSSISVTNAGTGYTTTQAPLVLIESPKVKKNVIVGAAYTGDHGIISAIRESASIQGATDQIEFELHIPTTSYLRNTNIVGTAITLSSLSFGDFFKVSNTPTTYSPKTSETHGIGADPGSTIGIGTTGLDNVYQVVTTNIVTGQVPGIGNTSVLKVIVKVNNNTGIGDTSNLYLGDYSWGLVTVPSSGVTTEFNVNTSNGVVGINTTPIIRRVNQLRSDSYNSL